MYVVPACPGSDCRRDAACHKALMVMEAGGSMHARALEYWGQDLSEPPGMKTS